VSAGCAVPRRRRRCFVTRDDVRYFDGAVEVRAGRFLVAKGCSSVHTMATFTQWVGGWASKKHCRFGEEEGVNLLQKTWFCILRQPVERPLQGRSHISSNPRPSAWAVWTCPSGPECNFLGQDRNFKTRKQGAAFAYITRRANRRPLADVTRRAIRMTRHCHSIVCPFAGPGYRPPLGLSLLTVL
jgi:hypothetical protein